MSDKFNQYQEQKTEKTSGRVHLKRFGIVLLSFLLAVFTVLVINL